MSNARFYAAVAIAGVALALAIRANVRGGSASPGSGSACIDEVARTRTEELTRAIAQRDQVIAQLSRAAMVASVPGGASASQGSPPAPPPALPGSSAIRRYAHLETSNPAVTVVQKDDGTYDIRTTDPALVGQTIIVTAVTATGEEDKMMIKIPE